MSYLAQKVAYLRGLAEGMEIETTSKEGRLVKELIDVLEDVVYAMDDLDEEVGELGDFVEAIDEDLADLEDDLYEDEDFEEDYDEDFAEEDYEEEEFIEAVCPECGEVNYYDPELFEGNEGNSFVCAFCSANFTLTE